MQSAILSSAMDYSCYVRILNPTNQPLTLTGRSAADGYWAVPPPQQIPPGGRGDGWLQDNPGLAGTEGAFSYDQAGKTLSFAVSCPTTTFKLGVRSEQQLRRSVRSPRLGIARQCAVGWPSAAGDLHGGELAMTDIDEVIVADEGAELVDEAAAAVAPAPWKPTSSLGPAV